MTFSVKIFSFPFWFTWDIFELADLHILLSLCCWCKRCSQLTEDTLWPQDSWIYGLGSGLSYCSLLRNHISVSINILCASSQLPARSLNRTLECSKQKGSESRQWKQAEDFLSCLSGMLRSPGLAEGCIIPKAEICKCPFAHRQAQGVHRSCASRTEAGKENKHAVKHSPGCEGKMTYVCLFPLRLKEC